MTATKKKPTKAHHKPAKARTVKPRRHRLHVPPGGASVTFSPTSMSQAMVDRLFWRAGFGPSAADRANWTGKPLDDAVDSLLNTPQGALLGAEPTNAGKALDPTGNDTDLVLAWVDRMVRTPNPLVERMTFFWHRHWANSRVSVSPTQLLMNQNALLRKYGDLAANPDVSFRDMALEVSKDPSMLRYLNGESNVKGGPNENYGREFMELFTLGVNHVITGAKNYTENDVAQLAKSFTGWYIDDKDPANAKALFDSGRWFNGPKSVFGKLGNYNTDSVVDLVLSQDGHAPYIVNKLWGEFMPTPPPTATLQKLSADYVASGRKIKPLAALDPHRSAAVRVDRRAQHDQAARRLRERRDARDGSRHQLHRACRLPRLDGSGPRTSRRPWRAGRAASRGSTRIPPSHDSASSGTSSATRRTAPRRRSSTSPTRRLRRPSTVPSARSGRPGCRPARVRRSRTTPCAPRSRPARTASPARSCCARSCSRAQTHR